MNAADSKFNDLYSVAAFIQAYSAKNVVPFEAYESCINSLYWGLRSERRSAIVPCLHLMDEILDDLEKKLNTGEEIK